MSSIPRLKPVDQPAATVQGCVPADYVRLLFDYLSARGADAAAVLGEAAPASGRGQGRSYPVQRWRALLERAAGHLGDPTLGLRVGASITPAHLGPLGYVLLASSSVSTAIDRYIRYQRLIHDISSVSCTLQDERIMLEWNHESRGVGLLVNQCGLAAVVSFARDLAGADVRPAFAHFVEPRPDDVAPYEALFQCPVEFGADATRLGFPLSLIGLPVRRADASLAAMLEPQVQQHLLALPPKDALVGEVGRRIAHHLPDGASVLDEVAADLNMSGRTLRRALAQQGKSFREVLEDVRWQLAQDYLREGRLALPEIALLLGYSEQSAFNRAFQRWAGTTPRAWRTANAATSAAPDSRVSI
jgi:AraC-like DNA-binding protein